MQMIWICIHLNGFINGNTMCYIFMSDYRYNKNDYVGFDQPEAKSDHLSVRLSWQIKKSPTKQKRMQIIKQQQNTINNIEIKTIDKEIKNKYKMKIINHKVCVNGCIKYINNYNDYLKLSMYGKRVYIYKYGSIIAYLNYLIDNELNNQILSIPYDNEYRNNIMYNYLYKYHDVNINDINILRLINNYSGKR